jgi:hypothetical protein
MPPTLVAADWRMTLAFLLLLVLLVVTLKLVAAARKPPPTGSRALFWISPLPATDSVARATPVGKAEFFPLIGRFALAVVGFLAAHWLLWRAGRILSWNSVGFGYLATPLVWLGTSGIAMLCQIICLPAGRLLPAAHEKVFAARSVAEFWGRRWDVWMSDWFRQVIFRPMRRRPVLAVVVVFLVSGVIHEFVINFGLWFVTGRNLFGSMMAYFGVQAAGVFVERGWLANCPWLKWLWTWIVVVGPAPLFINEGMLRALQFWP